MKLKPIPQCQPTRLIGVLGLLTLIAAFCPPAWAEDTLGRLFFTPERRQALDRQRQFNIEEKQEAPEDPTLTINGVVTRSSGKRTVWVNGVAQNDNETPSGVAIIPNRKTPGKIIVRSGDATVGSARVGETVNRNTGETSSILGEGEINVRSSSTK